MPVRGVACINDLITGLPAVITPYLFLSLSFYLSPSVLKGLCLCPSLIPMHTQTVNLITEHQRKGEEEDKEQ